MMFPALLSLWRGIHVTLVDACTVRVAGPQTYSARCIGRQPDRPSRALAPRQIAAKAASFRINAMVGMHALCPTDDLPELSNVIASALAVLPPMDDRFRRFADAAQRTVSYPAADPSTYRPLAHIREASVRHSCRLHLRHLPCRPRLRSRAAYTASTPWPPAARATGTTRTVYGRHCVDRCWTGIRGIWPPGHHEQRPSCRLPSWRLHQNSRSHRTPCSRTPE